jgi:hypothetical protein
MVTFTRVSRLTAAPISTPREVTVLHITVYDELGTKAVIVRVAFALLAGTIPLTHATAPSELEVSEGRRMVLIESDVGTP